MTLKEKLDWLVNDCYRRKEFFRECDEDGDLQLCYDSKDEREVMVYGVESLKRAAKEINAKIFTSERNGAIKYRHFFTYRCIRFFCISDEKI